MAMYTESDKERLIARFEREASQRKSALARDMERLAAIFEAKVQRRVNAVPKKFTQLRIKDVLTVERDHKIKIYELLKDVDALQQEGASALSEREIRLELGKLDKKKAEGLRMMQRRKESMLGRVHKPARER